MKLEQFGQKLVVFPLVDLVATWTRHGASICSVAGLRSWCRGAVREVAAGERRKGSGGGSHVHSVRVKNCGRFTVPPAILSSIGWPVRVGARHPLQRLVPRAVCGGTSDKLPSIFVQFPLHRFPFPFW